MSTFTPGQQVIVNGRLRATFVRAAGDGHAIVRIGSDTHLVLAVTLKAA